MPIAMAAAMAATTQPIGPVRAVNTGPSALTVVMIVPIAEIRPPINIISGPRTAVMLANANANVAICGCCFMKSMNC